MPCVEQDIMCTTLDIGVYINAVNYGNPKLNKIHRKTRKDYAAFCHDHMGPPM